MKNDNGRLLESRTITDKTGLCQRSLASLHKPGNRPGLARPGRQAGRGFDLTISCGALLPRDRHESSRILTETPLVNRLDPRGSPRDTSSKRILLEFMSVLAVKSYPLEIARPLPSPHLVRYPTIFFPGSIRFLDSPKIFFLLLFLFFNAVFFEYLSQLIQTLKSRARVSLIKSLVKRKRETK